MTFSLSRRSLMYGAGVTLFVSACGGAEQKSAAHRLDKIGLQMYTLRESFKEDPQATMRGVADIGYDFVEFAQMNFDGLSSPDEAVEMAKQLGLGCHSLHLFDDYLVERTDDASRLLDAFGARYAVVPFMLPQERTLDGFRARADMLNRFAPILESRGQRLAYHNHNFEWAMLENGKTGADYIYGETDPNLVDIELDFYWMSKAGVDVGEFCKAHSGRIKLGHIKDMDKNGDIVNVGEGVLDWPKLIAYGADAGMEHFIVENDYPPAPALQAVATSFANASEIRY